MNRMLLKVRDLHAYYGASHVLQGVGIDVGEREIVALLGRNGMGKSTTIKTIMGLVQRTSGWVTFDGREIAGNKPYQVARAGIGYVPEERRIFPELSVTDNLLLGMKGGRSPDPRDDSAWTLERIFQHFPMLKQRAQQKGRFLSGGEQQMLSIGRALMGNPRLLLVDEPTEGLAPLMVREVRNVLAEINTSGVSILLVEHNLKVALSLAHRVYLMGKAHVGFEGTVEELNENRAVRERYLEV
jgi:branched-chain amino acid transport system ATP-binding protein